MLSGSSLLMSVIVSDSQLNEDLLSSRLAGAICPVLKYKCIDKITVFA